MFKSMHECLIDLEEALRRMIAGVFLFFTEWFPQWIYEVLLNGLLPVMFRLVRVSALCCLWLVILFLPLLPGFVFHLAWWWKCGALVWLGLAILGSCWGLQRRRARIKAAKSLSVLLSSTRKKETATVPVNENEKKNSYAELVEDWPAE
jgi:hypothetical protein